MKESMRVMARPYAILFAISLVVALLARIGLGIMDAAGWLAYDYISASNVPMLDVICSILTGSAFVAFLFAAALTLMVSAAGAVLQATLFAKGVKGAGMPAAAFLWGWAAALVSLVCLLVVSSGILSGVQVGSMSSKLPGAPVLVLAAVCFTAFLGTLLGAASQVIWHVFRVPKDMRVGIWWAQRRHVALWSWCSPFLRFPRLTLPVRTWRLWAVCWWRTV